MVACFSHKLLLVKTAFPSKCMIPKSSEIRSHYCMKRLRSIEQQMRPVFILVCSFFVAVACPVMSWQPFFISWHSGNLNDLVILSLVKKVGRADGHLDLRSSSNPTRLVCWPHIPPTRATKTSLLRRAQHCIKILHGSFNQLFLL